MTDIFMLPITINIEVAEPRVQCETVLHKSLHNVQCLQHGLTSSIRGGVGGYRQTKLQFVAVWLEKLIWACSEESAGIYTAMHQGVTNNWHTQAHTWHAEM